MKFLSHKRFFFALLLSVATSAFSQEIEKFTIRGEIENPHTSTIHFSSFIRCDAATGCPKFGVNHEFFGDMINNNRDIIVSKQDHQFTLHNIEINKKSDKQIVFFFDPVGHEARVILEKKSAVNGVINIGKIKLEQTHLITGQITFPETFEKKYLKDLTVSFSYTVENNSESSMYLVGFTQMNKKDLFNIQLIPGTYTVFFDATNTKGDSKRVIKTITVEKSDVHLGTVQMSTALDNLLPNKASLKQVLKGFNLEQLDSDQTSVLQRIEESNHGITLVYFFAGYCSPCLSKDGISKYIKLAHEFPEQFAVIGIHSDSYRMTKNCPTSQAEMMDFVQNKWKNIQESYKESQENLVLLSFQPASFAESLSINGYPTILIFKDGIIHEEPVIGSYPETIEKVRRLLQK